MVSRQSSMEMPMVSKATPGWALMTHRRDWSCLSRSGSAQDAARANKAEKEAETKVSAIKARKHGQPQSLPSGAVCSLTSRRNQVHRGRYPTD